MDSMLKEEKRGSLRSFHKKSLQTESGEICSDLLEKISKQETQLKSLGLQYKKKS